ncbi:hypothetical protein ACIQF5_02090 [Streptomyces goshikiensis]
MRGPGREYGAPLLAADGLFAGHGAADGVHPPAAGHAALTAARPPVA